MCTCLLGLEYLIGCRWIPAAIYVPVKLVAMLGFIPFLLSSPIVSSVMVFVLSSRDREWLYLGLCDMALLVLLGVSMVAACV